MTAIAPAPATQTKRLSPLIEAAVIFMFLLAWLAPVIAAWAVSITGRPFSFVGQAWQNRNADIVGICILSALGAGVAAAGLVMGLLRGRPCVERVETPGHVMSALQRALLIAVLLISGWGLFVSFGGTILEKDYSGPTIAWLGYGAWSVTFVLSLGLLVGDHLAARPFRLRMVFVITAMFLPFLISGSRIDFLSLILALAVYTFALLDTRLHVRILCVATILAWGVLASVVVAKLRYPSVVPSPVALMPGMVYLSTFGDIGASVFQTIGLVRDSSHGQIAVSEALFTYLLRLVPGPLYPYRPADISSQLGEPIGGGALHALGEGYLISGYWGCGTVGALFGAMVAVSVYAGKRFLQTHSPTSWIVFLFPWLLLIRAGWYQFFALLKAIEILLLLLFMLKIAGWAGKRYSGKLIAR